MNCCGPWHRLSPMRRTGASAAAGARWRSIRTRFRKPASRLGYPKISLRMLSALAPRHCATGLRVPAGAANTMLKIVEHEYEKEHRRTCHEQRTDHDSGGRLGLQV